MTHEIVLRQFIDALPEQVKAEQELRNDTIQAFLRAVPQPPTTCRVQRVDEYVGPGEYRTTWEVVDASRAKNGRIVKVFESEDAESQARANAAIREGLRGGAYVYAAVDTDEPWHDTDAEQMGNMHLYGTISGGALTYDAADMTVDLAAGVDLHNGTSVTVAVAADAYTLVADGSNERWAALTVGSAGTAVLVSGDAAANAQTEPSKPEIGDRVLHGFAKIQAAQTIADNCEYKLDKRNMTHLVWQTIPKAADETINNSTTFQSDDELIFTASANTTYIARWTVIWNGNTAADIKFQLDTPSGNSRMLSVAQNASAAVVVDHDAASINAITEAGGASVPNVIQIVAALEIAGTGGTVALQWAQNTGHASDLTVKKGSILEYVGQA